MPLPSSGPIDLAQIQAEFGGSAPTGLDEYYQGAGTGFVTSSNYTPAGQIPSSGAISLANFYGVSKVSFSISGPTSINEGTSTNYTVTAAVPNGTTLFWTYLHGSTNSSDFGAPTSTITINSNTGTIAVLTAADSTTEGPQTFQLQLRTGSTAGPVVATSDVITINDTSQTPASFTFNDVVSSNLLTGYHLRNRAVAAGWNGTSALNATITVDAGVYIIGGPAFTLGGFAYPGGTTITLTNNGIIGGLGGSGGAGGSLSGGSMTNGAVGGTGGTGFSVIHPISVYNYGTIAGGGGGGGGGAARWLFEPGYSDKNGTYPDVTYGASGGGGAGGRANGAIGANGAATGNTFNYGVSPASTAGTLFAPGAGSGSSNVGPYGPDGAPGGAGGQFGQPGFPGGLGGGETTSNSAPGGGGAAGAAIQGGSNISWYVYGTRLGSIDHPGINMLPGGVQGPANILAWSSYVGVAGQSAYAYVSFQGNGNIELVEASTAQIATPQDAGDWYAPNTPGIGGNYWFRATRTSGSAVGYSGSPLGTWVNGGLTVQHSLSTGGFNQTSAVYNVAIATDSVGSNILVNHTVQINVDTEF